MQMWMGIFPCTGRPRVVKAVGDALGGAGPPTFLELCLRLCFSFASQVPAREAGVVVNPPPSRAAGCLPEGRHVATRLHGDTAVRLQAWRSCAVRLESARQRAARRS